MATHNQPLAPFDAVFDSTDESTDDSSNDASLADGRAAAAPRAADARGARGARKARARPSLKMQAIGYLSRREHSRQELRQKLLASLRQRAREDAALAAASEAAARELAQALSEQPSNGIDDAFTPTSRQAASGPATASSARQARGRAPTRDVARGHERDDADTGASTPRRGRASAGAPADSAGASAERACALPREGARRTAGAAPTATVADHLRLANGAAIPPRLRAELALQAGREEGAPGADDDALAAAPVAAAAPAPATDVQQEQQDPEAAVDELLDWLVANKYLSETRFVESRVNARARKQGTLMIKHELARHGLALEPEQAAALRETEFARAQALWQRKFGEVATEPRLRAKQARFLAARGFAADVVRRVVGGEEEEF